MKQRTTARIASLCLALTIFLCNFPIVARAAEPVTIDMESVSGDGTGYTYDSGTVTITTSGEYEVTGTTTKNHLVIDGGVTVNITLKGVTITSSMNEVAAIQLKGSAKLILTLSGTNKLTGGPIAPGLGVPADAALTIKGGGTLEAKGGKDTYLGAAGIGCGPNATCGTVTINGGTVIAGGDFGGAGIGSGDDGKGGTVTINGGTVTATGDWAAGIGGGYGAAGGDVTINGGTVTTIGNNGGAGIGGGGDGEGGAMIINGGTVTATSNTGGVGIGGGGGGKAGTTIINGGSVKAEIQDNPQNIDEKNVYLGVLSNQADVTSVSVDNKPYKIRGNHPDSDTSLYLYMPGENHNVDVQKGGITTQYVASWQVDTSTFIFDGGETGTQGDTSLTVANANATYGDDSTIITATVEDSTVLRTRSAGLNEVAFYLDDEDEPFAVEPVIGGIATAKLDISGWSVSNHTIRAEYGGSFGGGPSVSEDATLTIASKSLTITGLTAADKVYDGTTDVVVADSAGLVGVVQGDDVSLSGNPSFAFEDANVGTGKTITMSGAYSLIGEKSTNYSLTPPSLTATITQKGLTITGLTASDKEYDGTTIATASGTATLDDVIPADIDNVRIVEGTASFEDANVGDDKTVTFSGYSLTGTASGNYVLLSQPANATANITPKPLTITGLTASDKVYDGTVDAAVTTPTGLVGVVQGDDVSLSGDPTFAFEDTNVGTDKTITISEEYSLDGSKAANYSLTQPSLKADITQKPLTGATIVLNGQSFPYTGRAIEPSVSSVTVDGVAALSTDYAVRYLDNTAPGTASVTITATPTGNFSGSASTTFAIRPIPAPSTYQPSVSGALSFTGEAGHMDALRAVVQLGNAYFGEGLEFSLAIGDAAFKATATQNGELAFDLPAAELNKLATGAYKLTVQSEGNARNHALAPTEVGTLTITENVPTDWSMPKTFKATKGHTYALAKATPEGRAISGVTFKSSNKKVVTVDEQGVIVAKAKGKATITATEQGKSARKCAITVLANSFARKKPLMLSGGGLYSSTKKLSYSGDKLKLEIFLYNRTGVKVSGATELTLELIQNGKVLLSKPLPDWTPKNGIKHKAHGVYKLTLTAAELATLSSNPLDLSQGGVQAVLIGKGPNDLAITPLTPDMPDVTKPKGTEPEAEEAPPEDVEPTQPDAES